MFRNALFSTSMLALALFAVPAHAQDASKPVARVEGQTITEEDVRIALDELSPTCRSNSTPLSDAPTRSTT